MADAITPVDLTAPDNISVRRWFAFYAAIFLAAGAVLTVLLAREGATWDAWVHHTVTTFAHTSPAVKLLVFGMYISLACTVLPLPTPWLVAGLATPEVALANNVSDNWLIVTLVTTLLVAAVGAIGSTLANLNDYHLLTWMLRSHRVAKVRKTKTYDVSARWFAKSPFMLLVIFNILPLPVDVIRLLAITYRYDRGRFAAANFIGRFVRYGVIAFVTCWWRLGWIAVVALLGLAVVLGLWKAVPWMWRRLWPAAAAWKHRSSSND